MWPDRVSNPGPLTYESDALPTAVRGPALAETKQNVRVCSTGLLAGCFGFNGSLKQYLSLYRAVSQIERKEIIVGEKNVQITTIYCKHNRPLFYYYPNAVGIWWQNDVVSTTMRRHHAASTLIRRHFTSCAPGDFAGCPSTVSYPTTRSGGRVVDNTQDYQSRDRTIDSPLLRSFGCDFKPRPRLRMTSLLVGR